MTVGRAQTFLIHGERFTHAEAAKAYAADAVLTTAEALLPDKLVALPALALVVPLVGPALAPAALLAGGMWDVMEAIRAPARVSVAAAKAAYHGALAALGR